MILQFKQLKKIIIVISLAGCAAQVEPTMSSLSIDQDSVTYGLPSLTSTMIKVGDKNIRTCLGRGPDTTFNNSESGDMSLSLISTGTNEGANESANSGDSEMNGRTPGVLIAREILFRTCEFTNNYQLSKEDALKLYMHSLDTVGKGWVAEIQKTTITIGETLTTSDTNTISETSDLKKSLSSQNSNTINDSNTVSDSKTTSDSSDIKSSLTSQDSKTTTEDIQDQTTDEGTQ